MSKKFLLITGAGASKSLTASLPQEQKVGLIGGGGFRELPTGAELIQNIIKYQDKSLIFLCSKLIFTFLGIHECDHDFFSFTHNFEYINGEFKKAKEDAAKKYYDFSVPDGYENSIKKKVVEINTNIKEWIEKEKSLATVVFGNSNGKNLVQLIEHSSFVTQIINDLSNECKRLSFDECFSDNLFIKFIYYALACNHKNFNSIKKLFNNNRLIDLFLNDLYNKFKNVISSISGLLSYGNISIYDSSRRFNGVSVVGNSIYKARQDAFEERLEQIMPLLKAKEYSHEALTTTLNNFITELNSFILKLEQVILLSPLDKPTFQTRVIELGQNNYAREFHGLFGIKIIDESKREHNINSTTVKLVSNFRDNVMSILEQLDSAPTLEEPLKIFNEIIDILLRNGFDLSCHHQGNTIIQQAQVLKNEILAYLYATTIEANKIISTLEIQINQMKQCYIAAAVVRHYQPFSIDYFMMNIKQIASYEFSDIANDDTKITTRINNLHQYTKLIIADILMGHVSFAYHARDDNNYLRHMIWRFLEAAHFTGESLEKFILSSVEVINFNYELSFLMMLYDFLPTSVVNEFANKEHGITPVYGCIDLEDTSKQKIYMSGEHAIWNALFKIEAGRGSKISTGSSSDLEEIYCNNLLGQISDKIKWIGEKKEEENASREKFQYSFVTANEIYILGFGFDVNNLYNLGLINKEYKLEDKIFANQQPKVIYISGGNAKIISTLKNIFSITEQDVVDHVYHLKNPKLNLDIYVSKKHLPEALETDL